MSEHATSLSAVSPPSDFYLKTIVNLQNELLRAKEQHRDLWEQHCCLWRQNDLLRNMNERLQKRLDRRENRQGGAA